ncbi:MAG TPA: NRDE family protein [Gemmataceae bacterium]|nr:NRDE family protein [Gemmataceae bacterium]
MCLIALFIRVVEDSPLVVGANREEAYARGGEPPRLLDGPCRAVAGIDPRAGGTWLGVNEHDVLVAVTNRHKTDVPPRPRSRGLLARDLLACPSAAAAAEWATRELAQNRYAGCNVVVADPSSAVVIQASDWLRVRPLPPGLHVLTNHDLNDPSDCRIGHALRWLSERSYLNAEQCLEALRQLCGQTGQDGTPPICLRNEESGTVSSSLIALRQPRWRSIYLHAQGPPDCTPYADYSHLLHQLDSAPPRGA